jgi:hypothetical protein
LKRKKKDAVKKQRNAIMQVQLWSPKEKKHVEAYLPRKKGALNPYQQLKIRHLRVSSNILYE